jgi:hypothetical protein
MGGTRITASVKILARQLGLGSALIDAYEKEKERSEYPCIFVDMHRTTPELLRIRINVFPVDPEKATVYVPTKTAK